MATKKIKMSKKYKMVPKKLRRKLKYSDDFMLVFNPNGTYQKETWEYSGYRDDYFYDNAKWDSTEQIYTLPNKNNPSEIYVFVFLDF